MVHPARRYSRAVPVDSGLPCPELPTMNAPLPLHVTAEAASARTARQAEVVAALAAVVPAHALLWQREDTGPYECDGLTAYRELPLVVVLLLSQQLTSLVQVLNLLAVWVSRALKIWAAVLLRSSLLRLQSLQTTKTLSHLQLAQLTVKRLLA
jgi:hypothetical protein